MRGQISHLTKAAGLDSQPGKLLVHVAMGRKGLGSPPTTYPGRPRASHINDNYCIAPDFVTRLTKSRKTLEQCQTLSVDSFVADHVPYVVGHPQKKGLHPVVKSIMSVKGVYCVARSSFVQTVTNIPVVAQNLPVGDRLDQFWET